MNKLRDKILWIIFITIWIFLIIFIMLTCNVPTYNKCDTVFETHVKVFTIHGDTADIHSDSILIKKY